MTRKLVYYVQKSMRIGVRNVVKIGYMRARFMCWRYYVLQDKRVSRTYDSFFACLKPRNLSYIKKLYDTAIHKEQIIEEAQLYTHNEFCFLGSDAQRYDQIPWHKDFRLQQQDRNADVIFDDTSFYCDLRIKQGTKNACIKDIKVPWELSRFQYLYVLGKAYEYTNDQIYVETFQRYVTDWLDKNSYLCGINWLCPMEVSIRAINWIVAWDFVKCAPTVTADFRQRFISSLYDHMIYLENNWEYYDSRTNNHYISNLVAYLYLCWFFSDLPGVHKKRTWVVQEILREFEKQVFAEGTSYEGSTHYHCLVTELFYHAYVLFQEMDICVPDYFHTTLSRMFDFINWCTVNGALVSIGDNDSGKVLQYGLTQNIVKQMQTPSVYSSPVADFPQFGLSIIKTNNWHVTLRHHAYNALQPSGHFHNDIGSITLAVNGIPVIVDPGSFVYTPSTQWRNDFRSVAVHNTSFLDGIEPVLLTDELFALNIPECEDEYASAQGPFALSVSKGRPVYASTGSARTGYQNEYSITCNNSISLCTKNTLYKRLGLQFIRYLQVMDTGVQIHDAWIGGNKSPHVCSWNFTLAPDIKAYSHGNGVLLTYHQEPLLMLQSSDLTFTVHETWVSPSYGKKIAAQCLRASRLLDGKQVMIELLRV